MAASQISPLCATLREYYTSIVVPWSYEHVSVFLVSLVLPVSLQDTTGSSFSLIFFGDMATYQCRYLDLATRIYLPLYIGCPRSSCKSLVNYRTSVLLVYFGDMIAFAFSYLRADFSLEIAYPFTFT